MMRARPLAIASPLTPTIGLQPRDARTRRRRGAPTHWRRTATDRVFPQLRLSIQPMWNLSVNLDVRRGDEKVCAVPVPSVSERQRDFLPSAAQWRRIESHKPVSRESRPGAAPAPLRHTPGRIIVTQIQSRLPGAEQGRSIGVPHSTTFLSSTLDARTFAQLANQPGRESDRAVLPITCRIVGARGPAGSSAPIAPARVRAQFVSASAQPSGRTSLERRAVALAHPPPITTIPVASERRGNTPPPFLARSVFAWLPSPASETRPRRRRVPVDLAWRPRTNGQVTAQDLATLVRSVSAAPNFGQSIAAPRVAPSSPGASQAVLPDAGRLVDEVMDRIERRIRSDRLRRGL